MRGFTDELLATFGQIQALTVKPGVGSGGAGRTSQEIARVLDVDALLTTTLSSDDGARDGTAPLVVRAQLVAAGTGAVIGPAGLNGPAAPASGCRTSSPSAIASAVLPGKNVAVPPQRTTNPEAEVAYLLGRSHLDRYGAGSADLALKAFERARDIDPSHAAALVGAARARISMGLNGAIPHQQARTQALADVHKALAIDPNLAEGYATLAHISFIYDWNFQLAERNFQKALELNPSQSVRAHLLRRAVVGTAPVRRVDRADRTGSPPRTGIRRARPPARRCSITTAAISRQPSARWPSPSRWNRARPGAPCFRAESTLRRPAGSSRRWR